MEKKRSIGVTIIGILSILGGIAGIILNVRILIQSFHLLSFVAITLGLFSIFTGGGVLKLKEWARNAEIFLCIFVPLLLLSLFFIASHGSIEDILLTFFQVYWLLSSLLKETYEKGGEKYEQKYNYVRRSSIDLGWITIKPECS